MQDKLMHILRRMIEDQNLYRLYAAKEGGKDGQYYLGQAEQVEIDILRLSSVLGVEVVWDTVAQSNVTYNAASIKEAK